MKILSFDVGIKNLAYCLINKTNDENFKIEDWGKINLDDEKLICNCNLRNNKKCLKNANYYYEKNNVKIYLCK